jgi:D-glycero-alpha-D-manno-heptose-7-phosphate kinase
MEFDGERVLVNPLRIGATAMAELEYSLVLAYTGQSRSSSTIIQHQMENYADGVKESVVAMDRTRELAELLKHELLRRNHHRFGELLHEAWEHKKRMSSRISSTRIDEIYAAARSAGALGGKISGAGGGGFMFFFTEFDKRHAVEQALQKLGAEVVYFGFTEKPVLAWER